jgi:hypothetical protein
MLVDVLDTKLEEKLKPIYDSIGEVKASLKFLSDKCMTLLINVLANWKQNVKR